MRGVTSLVLFLMLGVAVGALARWLSPGRAPRDWGASIAVGVIGSMSAGLAGGYAGFYADGEPGGFVMSLLGAAVVTIAYHWVMALRSSTVV